MSESDSLNKEERDELLDYVLEMAVILGLSGWRLRIFEEPCDEYSHATINLNSSNLREADIDISSSWKTLSRARRKQVVIHELLHCYFEPINLHMDGLVNQVGSGTWEVFRNGYRMVEERAVDDLSVVLAGLVDDKDFAMYLPEEYP